jgi:hypothetical protein
MKVFCKRLLPVLLLCMASAAALWSQSDHGTITGTVSDPSGAVIASVDVVATQVSTGVQFKAVSSGHGFYSLLELPVGVYNVMFTKEGFEGVERAGIVMSAQHTIEVNAALHVGSVTQTVTVTEAAPVLEMQVEVGTNMNAQALTDLPTSIVGGRDMTAFAFAVTPNVSGSEWSSSISGSQAFTKSVLIDGTSTDSGIVGHVAESSPSMDAIQEAQVDTTGLRAEDGRSGGGAFLYEMKSGTEHFHGASFGFLDNEALNANTWDNNWWLTQCGTSDTDCSQYRRAKYRYFDYGFSGGGPVWRKWLGVKQMYIFAAYEKYMQADWATNPTGGTVPTTKMLTGDFSELLTAAATAQGSTTCPSAPCAIMNGTTPYTDGAGNTIYYGSIFNPSGNVYAGNIITDSLSPIAQKVTSYYQQYYKPTTSGVVNNFPSLSNDEPWFHQTQLSFKYDWKVSPNDSIAASYIYTLRPRTCTGPCGNAGSTVLWQTGTTSGGPLTSGQQQTVIGNAYRVSETHTFTANILNVIGFTFNAFQNKGVSMTKLSSGTNLADEVGLGSVESTGLLPYITLNGSPNGLGETSIGTRPAYAGGGYVSYNGIVNEALSWNKGRHTFKFGGEYRALGFNSDTEGGQLEYNFSNNTFAPTNSKVQPYVGSAFASLLLGEVQSASEQLAFNLDSRRKELSFFAQDDIRVNRRLTISADLRWELTQPLHVLGGKWSNFNPTTPNQAFGDIPGSYTWLAHPGDSFETYADWHQFAPKIGFSYLVTSKLVARGSFGINYVPMGWNGYSGTPYGSSVGYSGNNQVVEVSAAQPAFQWDASNYPGVYTAPTGPAPASAAAQSVWGPASVDPKSRQLGMMDNWFAGLQYQLPGNTVFEVSYLGSSGRNLHDGALNPTNYPTWSTYSTLLNSGNIWNWVWDEGSAASAGVPYPYAGFSGEAYFAINPFPQVQACYCGGVFFTNSPMGKSGYNAVTFEAKKQRGSLNLDLSYNWSHTTGNTNSAFFDTWSFGKWYQDPYKYKDEAHWPWTNQTIKGYLIYSLPFGKGRRYLSGSRMLNVLVGGWQAGTLVSYGNAGQMSAVGSSNYYPGWSAVYTNVASHANFKNVFKRYNPGWNPTASGAGTDDGSLFVDPTIFSNPTYGELGNSPSMFTNWRGWATPQENASLLKKTHFGPDGRYTFTVRGEFFNVFNRHYWDSPNVSYGTAYFGHVTGVSGNRTGQVGARFEW